MSYNREGNIQQATNIIVLSLEPSTREKAESITDCAEKTIIKPIPDRVRLARNAVIKHNHAEFMNIKHEDDHYVVNTEYALYGGRIAYFIRDSRGMSRELTKDDISPIDDQLTDLHLYAKYNTIVSIERDRSSRIRTVVFTSEEEANDLLQTIIRSIDELIDVKLDQWLC